MPPSVPPTVRLRKLTASLRSHRSAADLDQLEAAAQLGFSQSKMSRIESGAVRPKPSDVEAMLDLYGVKSPEREALLGLARETDRRGWWTAYDDLFSGAFAALEDEAESITSWEGLLVPGLLQIADYAEAVISTLYADDPDGVHRRVAARMNRRMILRRPSPPQLHAYIGEAVLHQQVGGREVLQRQLLELREAAVLPNVTLQVVPFTASAHMGLEGSVTLFGFSDYRDLDVAHIEGLGGPVYLESADDLQRIRVGLHNIASMALSPDESRDLLAKLAK